MSGPSPTPKRARSTSCVPTRSSPPSPDPLAAEQRRPAEVTVLIDAATLTDRVA